MVILDPTPRCERLVHLRVQVPQAVRHEAGTHRRRSRRSCHRDIDRQLPLPNSPRRSSGRDTGRGIDQQQAQQTALEDPVAHQVDPLGQPLHGHTVVVGEAGRDADHPWTPPVDRLGRLRPQHLLHECFELVVRRLQPGQVGDGLRQHPVVGPVLALDHCRAAVLVQPEGVDPTPGPRTGRVLRRQEPHAEHRLQRRLDPTLQLHLQRHRRTPKLDVRAVGTLPERHQIGHSCAPFPAIHTREPSKRSAGHSGRRTARHHRTATRWPAGTAPCAAFRRVTHRCDVS